jgi:hypothetical protein
MKNNRIINRGIFGIQHCFICCPSVSTVSGDTGIEPRTVGTSVLAVRSSSHSARSHPQNGRIAYQKMMKVVFILVPVSMY